MWRPMMLGAALLPMLWAVSAGPAEDWTMLGGSPERNRVASDQGIVSSWDPDTGDNVRWSVRLGSQTYTSPVVADGQVYVGTNNDNPRDPEQTADAGVLLAFSESDGEFLWQALSPKLASGAVNDWPYVGVSSTPMVEGDRLYYVTNRCELVCLDTRGFRDGENDGPFTAEESGQPQAADIVWKLDMIGELGVFPHNMSNSSPAAWRNLVFVGTSNGQNEDHSRTPAPTAPSLIAVDKNTGEVVWSDNSPGDAILNGQWTSPTVATIGGTTQVILGQGDGWVRSFEAASGAKLWEFDTNPKDSVYPRTRNEILGTAVVDGDHIIIANGQDPENGEGPGHLYRIDATGRGDITVSGLVWHYGDIRRSISSAAISEGLLFIPDFSGFFHCLDASTGKPLWVHDTLAAIWGSPLIAGNRVYQGDEDGELVVLEVAKQEKVLAEIYMGDSIYSTPVAANGTLFIVTMERLFAIGD